MDGPPISLLPTDVRRDYIAGRHHSPRVRRQSRLARLLARRGGFLLCVVLPTLLSSIYYFGFAADQYESEARFVIRSAHEGGPQLNGLGQMLGFGGGSGSAMSETFSVIDFLQSHDAVGELNKKIDLTAAFRRAEADPVSRLWWSKPSAERLLRYYRGKVTLTYRQETGITTMDIHAFRPDDATFIASTLLQLGEDRVNTFNERATEDTVRVAKAEVDRAEQRIEQAERAVTEFRQQHQDLDPERSGVTGMSLIARLQEQLAQANSQMAQMQGYLHEDSPQVLTLRNRISALEAQIASQSGQLTGADGALAPVLAHYDDLTMRRQFAQQNYTVAQAALERAREDALKQQLFLIRVVEPNVPQTALYPQRFLMVGTIFAGLLVAYGIGWLLIAGIREHAI